MQAHHVLFGPFSPAKEKLSLGVTFKRTNEFDIEQADEHFCNARLKVHLKTDPVADNSEPADGSQTVMYSTVDAKVENVADVAGKIKFGRDDLNITLQFQGGDLELERQLSCMRYREGTIKFERTGDSEVKAGRPARTEPDDPDGQGVFEGDNTGDGD